MLIVKEEDVWILIIGHRNNQVTGANVWLNAEIKQEEKKNKQPTHLDERWQD